MDKRVFRAEMVPWVEPPAHFGGFSKFLVNPENLGSKYFDFRVSSYQPKGYAEAHTHKVCEQIYYVLQGTGLLELDGEKHLVGPHTAMFIPPGVRHGIANTGFEDLVFIVATCPPDELPRPK